MRIHQVNINFTTGDLTSIVQEFAPDAKLRISRIEPGGIHGQVKLLLWNIDFVARPMTGTDGSVSLDISAGRLVPIPSAIVERQLKEAIKDAPPGVDVIRQALKVHLPSILGQFGIQLTVKELRCGDGILYVTFEDIDLPSFRQLMGAIK